MIRILGLAVFLVGHLTAQSYQSSFSEVRFDRGKGPLIHHGELTVEPASGAASLDLPLGPGIGARGVRFTPALRARWAPQAKTQTYLELIQQPGNNNASWQPLLSSPWISFNGETQGILRPTATWGNYGGIQFPDGKQTGFNWINATPAPITDSDAMALVNRFLGTSMPLWKYRIANGTSSCVRVTQSGDLVIALTDDSDGRGTAIPNGRDQSGSPVPDGFWKLPVTFTDVPKSLLVISADGGEVAYWFTYHKAGYRESAPKFPDDAYNFPPSNQFSYYKFQNATYILDRMVGRHGDKVQFSTLADSQNTGQSYTASWTAGGGPLASVQVQWTAAGWTITYPGSGPAISYSLSAELASASIPPAPNDVVPGESTMDAAGQWRDEPISGREIGIPTQLSLPSGDQIRWNYRDGAQFGTGRPRLLDSVDFPGKTVTLGWNSYLYRAIRDIQTLSTTGQDPCWFWGVTSLTERDTIGGSTKASSYARTIPAPKFATSAPRYYGQLTDNEYDSSTFTVTVTLPDGTQRVQVYSSPVSGNPGTDENKVRHLAFLKNQMVWESVLKPGGTAYQYRQTDRFDVRMLVNSSGDLTRASQIYPTRVQSVDYDLGTAVTEEDSAWDSLQYAWTRHSQAVRAATSPDPVDWLSLARRGQSGASYGSATVLRTTTRSFHNDMTQWLVRRVTSERTTRDQDSTGSLGEGFGTESYITRSFLSAFNTVSSQSHGESPQVTLSYALGSSGLAAANPSAVTLSSPGLTYSGSAGAGYQYDAYGYLARISPSGVSWNHQQSQDAFGRVTSQTDPNGLVTGFGWDALGRLTAITPPTPRVPTSIAYPSLFSATVTRGALSETYRYDGFGNLVGIDRPGGSKTLRYDLNGRLTFESIWGSSTVGTTFEYDHRGRRKRVQDPNGVSTTTTYSGRNWTVTTGASSSTFSQDVLGQLTGVDDGVSTVSYLYNLQGKLVKATQAGRTTGGSQMRTWSYNPLGWMTSQSHPETGTLTFGDWNVFGKPSSTSHGGSVLWTGYDAIGRVVSQGTSRGSANLQSFSYDEAGRGAAKNRLTTAVDRGVTEYRSYDAMGRLSTLDTRIAAPASGGSAGTYVQNFGYDGYDRRTSASLDGRSYTTHYDDAKGLPDGLTGQGLSISAGYDPASWSLTSLALPKGVTASFGYGADQVRLASLGYTGPRALSWSYHYDGQGRLDWIQENGGTKDEFNYDTISRLTFAKVHTLAGVPISQTFGYDDFGNPTSVANSNVPSNLQSAVRNSSFQASATAAANRIPATTAGGANTGASYDAKGNLLELWKTPGDPLSYLRMTYDELGRVISLVDNPRNVTENYAFTPSGLRTRVEVLQNGQLVQLVHRIYNDQRQLVAEYAQVPVSGSIAPPAGSAAKARSAGSDPQKFALTLGEGPSSQGHGNAPVVGTRSKIKKVKWRRNDGPTTRTNTLLAGEPLGAYITSPIGGFTIQQGTTVSFTGTTDYGTGVTDTGASIRLTWDFGDGTPTVNGATVNHTFNGFGTFTVTLTSSAVGFQDSSDSMEISVMAIPLPVIQSFTATPSAIQYGESSTLAWATSGATSLGLVPNPGQYLTLPNGSLSLSLTTGATYVLTATNVGGSASQGARIYVTPKISSFAPRVNGQPVTGAVAPGTAVTLNWTLLGAQSVMLGIQPSGGNPSSVDVTNSGSSTTVYPTVTTTYTLNASNADGTVVSSFTVEVGALPVITQQPQAQSVTAPAPATFTVAATGATGYQWYRNGSLVAGATSASYTTPATSGADHGASFTVAVRNAVGSVTSQAAALSVTVASQPPVISYSPNRRDFVLGVAVSPVWTPANSGGAAGLWSVAPALPLGLTLDSATGVISGTPTALSALAAYMVTASNAAGSGSTSISLLVSSNSPPGITTQPSDRTVSIGETATFTVTATGLAPLAYQWYGNGAPIAGATAASYTTPATTYAMNGWTYYVVVSNSLGTLASRQALLTVTAPVAPTITVQPVAKRVTEGQTASFSVTATGTAPLSYQWKKNSVAISGATAASYVTPPTLLADSGAVFSVVVSNGVGSATSQGAILTVDPSPAPSITTQPADASVEAGLAATFTVVATGQGTLSYQWYRIAPGGSSGTALPGATAASYTTPPTVLSENGAKFYVAVTNTSGGAQSRQALLIVRAPMGPMTWQRDVVYLGMRQVAEVSPAGPSAALVDHLGTPRVEIAADGAQYDQKYLPFGESLTDPTTMAKFAKGFTNHEQTEISGLIYMQARWYSPVYHKFLSPDPGRDQQHWDLKSWNMYNYCRNNSITQVDPNGEEVRIYTERLWKNGYGLVSLADVRHGWIRVTTDKYDKIIERGGDGNIKIANWYKGAESRGIYSRSINVTRPQGSSRNDFKFEDGIYALAQLLKGNKEEGHEPARKSQNPAAIPPYDPIDANCNGFLQFLIQANGGNADFGPIGKWLEMLTRGEIHSAKIHLYWKKYIEYIENEKKQEEKNKKETEEKKEEEK